MRRAIQSLRSSMAPRPINLVLDWDGTITTKDTMFAYGKVADIRDGRLGRNPTGTATFNGFGKAWMDDYTKHEQNYTPKAENRRHPSQESAWLKSLSAVETSSAERVESSGFFAGVTLEDVSDAAKVLLESGELSLRAGWEDVFSRAFRDSISQSHRDRGIPGLGVSILSVNWSESFIRRSLMTAASRASLGGGGGGLEALINGDIKIIANEISGLQRPDGSSGLLTDPDHAIVRTSFDRNSKYKTTRTTSTSATPQQTLTVSLQQIWAYAFEMRIWALAQEPWLIHCLVWDTTFDMSVRSKAGRRSTQNQTYSGRAISKRS
jgi:hypothetical protein